MQGFLAKTQATAIIVRHLMGQSRIPYLPEERLRKIRDARVRRIVHYAAETVPYYRDLLRELKIDPRDIRRAEDLEHLPLVTKAFVREHADLFLSTSASGKSAIPLRTSGTSGIPLTVWHDRESFLARFAYELREKAVDIHMLGRRPGYREVAIVFPGNVGSYAASWMRENTFVPYGVRVLRLSVLEPLTQTVAAINNFRPDLLKGYGSYLEMLFKTVAARGMHMHLPRLAVYFSDQMTDKGRRLIEHDFGVPVLSRYSAVEAAKIGFECEERRGFHVHSDLTHLKIVDPAGRPAPTGEVGKVVISNLVNRGTVLINYLLGDRAALTGQLCPCGRTLPLLAALDGRSDHVIHLSSGETVPPATIWMLFEGPAHDGGDDVLQYSLIQHTRDRFELRLATANRGAFERAVPRLLSRLRDVLGTVVIETVYYKGRLSLPEGGKVRTIVSHVDGETRGKSCRC